MIQEKVQRFVITTAAALATTLGFATAGDKCLIINDKEPVECCKEDPGFCEIFDYSTIYKNENNCLIQKVQLLSRYHGQHHSTSLDFDNGGRIGASFWEHRRFRHGLKVQFLNDFTFWNEWNSPQDDLLTADNDGFFRNIDEIGIKWAPSKDFFVSVGKQKVKITQEWATSSKRILAPERSHIVNEVIASTGKPYGVNVGFKALGLKHQIGAWLTGTVEDARELTTSETRGGASYLVEAPLTDNTDLHFGYLFTNNSDGQVRGRGNADRLEMSPYNHVFALGTESHWDIGHCDRKFGLYADLVYGIDRERRSGNDLLAGADNDIAAGEDTFGFYILPYYDLTERLQLVGRYAYASNTRIHRGQRAPFDEDPTQGNAFATGGRPNLEDVHTLFIGANYRLCGDHLKILGGYEYSTGDVKNSTGGFTGDTWILGVRTYF